MFFATLDAGEQATPDHLPGVIAGPHLLLQERLIQVKPPLLGQDVSDILGLSRKRHRNPSLGREAHGQDKGFPFLVQGSTLSARFARTRRPDRKGGAVESAALNVSPQGQCSIGCPECGAPPYARFARAAPKTSAAVTSGMRPKRKSGLPEPPSVNRSINRYARWSLAPRSIGIRARRHDRRRSISESVNRTR